MRVYEHSDPEGFERRSHPWTTRVADPSQRYRDFRAEPGLIRTTIEDLQAWPDRAGTETFYRLLEWLNGPDSSLESNDCAFSEASDNAVEGFDKRLQASGRLMLLFRDLRANTVPERVHDLTQAFARALSQIDPAFEWGAVGATLVPTRFTGLAGSQEGQQLMLSFWVWGDDEAEVWENFDRTLRNVGSALRVSG